MLQAINEAKQNNTDIIIFPEMCIPGYLLGDTWEQTAFFKRLFKLWRRYYRSFSRYLYHFW